MKCSPSPERIDSRSYDENTGFSYDDDFSDWDSLIIDTDNEIKELKIVSAQQNLRNLKTKQKN